MIELIFKVSTSILLPLAQQRARRYGQLVWRSADDRLYIDPIRMPAQVVLAAIVRAVALQWRHQINLFEPKLAAVVGVSQLPLRVISDRRPNPIIEERSVLH